MRKAMSLGMLMVAVACLTQAAWIDIKASVAQLLITRAWHRNQAGAVGARPWPWADTTPVARLVVPGARRQELVVLEGSSGRNLAFGPTHDPASVFPGERGNSVIAGHRDTHFRFLKDLKVGDRVAIERPGGVTGRTAWFTVTATDIVDSRKRRIALQSDLPRLTLVTCYPFNAVTPGGPLRYVVTADLTRR